MARFIGSVQGNSRNPVTRLGNASRGMTTSCRGWSIGVDCGAECIDPDSSRGDEITVGFTRGSDNSSMRTYLVARRGDDVELHLGLDFGVYVPATKENAMALACNKELMDLLYTMLWASGEVPREPAA